MSKGITAILLVFVSVAFISGLLVMESHDSDADDRSFHYIVDNNVDGKDEKFRKSGSSFLSNAVENDSTVTVTMNNFLESGTRYEIKGTKLIGGTGVDINATMSETGMDSFIITINPYNIQNTLYTAKITLNKVESSGTKNVVLSFLPKGYFDAELDFSVTTEAEPPILNVDSQKEWMNVKVSGLEQLSKIIIASGLKYVDSNNSDYRVPVVPNLVHSYTDYAIIQINTKKLGMDPALTTQISGGEVVRHSLRLQIDGEVPKDSFDRLITATIDVPNVQLYEEYAKDSRITIKYVNPGLNGISKDIIVSDFRTSESSLPSSAFKVVKSYDDNAVLIKIVSFIGEGYCYDGTITVGNEANSFIFSISLVTEGYWDKVIDSKQSAIVDSIDCVMTSKSDMHILINNMDSNAILSYDIPGIEITIDRREKTEYSGNVILTIQKLNIEQATYGTRIVSISDGNNNCKFNIVVQKYTILEQSNGYDFEVYSASGITPSEKITWNIADKSDLTIKINFIAASQNYSIGVYIGLNTVLDGISVSELDYSYEGRYAVIKIEYKSISELPIDARFVFNGQDGNYYHSFGSIPFTVVNDPSSMVVKYDLAGMTSERGSNIRFDISIRKAAGEDLADSRLLVIAKYGNFVINFYSKPVIEGGSGSDVIEVSKLGLTEIFIEMVDGFQDGVPLYYGIYYYKVNG